MRNSVFRFALLLPALCAPAAPDARADQEAPPIGGMYSTYKAGEGVVHERGFDTAPAENLDQVVRTLTRAIDRLARYKVQKSAPAIYRIPHAELERYVCGTNCSIQAWYKPSDGIYLDDTLKPETNLFHRSILLHEMVHYFQDLAGEYGNMDACNRWFHRELDAYTIQNRYLGVIGHPGRVAYTGDNCSNMQAHSRREAPSSQAFDAANKGRVDPDSH
jgi:hypothetical protein